VSEKKAMQERAENLVHGRPYPPQTREWKQELAKYANDYHRLFHGQIELSVYTPAVIAGAVQE
jgi:hypothetical protein